MNLSEKVIVGVKERYRHLTYIGDGVFAATFSKRLYHVCFPVSKHPDEWFLSLIKSDYCKCCKREFSKKVKGLNRLLRINI